MVVLEALVWLSLAGVGYIYAGYPLLIGALARFFPRTPVASPNDLTATVVLSIYNEAPRLAVKIRNILAAEGSSRIREILIGSDGSEDDPAGAIRDIDDHRIRLIAFPERRGKPSVLNDLVPLATGDIVVMMDVRQRLDERALPALLDNFSDPSIGVVSGELVFERSNDDTAAAGGIDAYWRYEKWIRDREGRFGSVPGATGALYAIRRELIAPLPGVAALDDVIIPMRAIAAGYRCVFEPKARIYDRPAQDAARESIRKRRTLAGCVQLMRLYPRWCVPFGHPIWWQFGSHKIARLFSPVLMAAALAACIPLASTDQVYAGLLGAQVLFYALGGLGLPRVIRVFLQMQAALLLAWKDGIARENLALWKKADGAK